MPPGATRNSPITCTRKIFSRVLVIRKDMVEPHTPHQVKALTEHFGSLFILLATDRYSPLMSLIGTKVRKARTKVMGERVSRAKFEEFFQAFKEQKVRGGDELIFPLKNYLV
ncbi:hypothetical protein L207DRAFT_291805 [Hyaloscypha variabilis F]|uniref:Uncharacterized protein n=1 Tax=Hyaloscypha variabilis (strain UAMH 11265 / GT02V1 / F) TaxID=1149755 RepID=A0A2J6RXG6_HYAVF|nr:hypothetical protein L207DRAFT_291805 [Hyaloscypha variabilis F]